MASPIGITLLLIVTLGSPLFAGETPQPHVDWQGDPLPAEARARMGSSRLRHPGYVRSLAFSADGKSLVSGAGNGVRIWDTTTGQLRRRFDVPTNWTLSFAFTAEGILVASAGIEKGIVTLQAIDPASGNVRRRFELPDRATTANVTLSHDGKWLAYGHQNNIRLHDTASGRELLRLPAARDIAFAPDGKTVALCDYSDTVRIHDTASGECTRRLQRKGDHVAHIAISPDGRSLASIPWIENEKPGEISIWDLRTGKERHRLQGAGGHVLSAAFSPDGKYVAVGCQHDHLLLFDLATGKEVRRYPTDAFFASIAFSSDGKMIAAASGVGTIRLWETATGRVLPASADPLLDSIHELRFSGDGRRLLGHAGIHLAWDVHTGRELRRFPKVSDRPWPAALAPDESLLATADSDGTIRLWDATTGREIRTLKGHDKWVWRMVFAPDGRRLISTGEDASTRVWDVANGREIHKIASPQRMMCLVVSPDGRWLAAASDQRGSRGGYEVVLWNLTTGEEKSRFAMLQNMWAQHLAFSSNSRLLAAVGGGRRGNDPGEIQIWNVTGGQPRRSLNGHKSRVASVAFSPDNRTLATGSQDGELFLWELASGRKRHRFVGHESWIKSLAFSPDGRLLAASSNEAPALVWDVLGVPVLKEKPSVEELRRWWGALAGDDAETAFQAIRQLVAAPEQTLPLLRQHLKPIAAVDAKSVRRRIDDLDSDNFEQREKAADELEKLGEAALPSLRQALEGRPSLEVRQRLRSLIERLDAPTGERLRGARSVEVLEWIGTDGARKQLNELATGAPGARLTREATGARERLRR
jgi:WD40 repeat protein